MSITITTAKTKKHLHQILALQKINLPKFLSAEEKRQEGFVTVDHDLDTLKKMNKPYPHIIAMDGQHLIGYALVMLKSIRNDIEILKPMFDKIDGLTYKSMLLSAKKYLVMGQVCIAKAYRGQGIFNKMYDHLKATTQHDFDLLITEVSSHNKRSLKDMRTKALKISLAIMLLMVIHGRFCYGISNNSLP